MKSRFPHRRVRAAAGVCSFVILFFAADAFAKPIRLRNQFIDTPAGKSSSARTSAATPANRDLAEGLYLVQFQGPLTARAAAQIEALGVDLLQYVPDDTFIARMEARRASLIESLPIVHWVGEYQPEHKVHHELQTRARAAAAADAVSRVSIVLAPRAKEPGIASVRRALNSLQQEARAGKFRILRGSISHGRLQALANSVAVLWVEPQPPLKLVDEVASKIVAGDGGPQKLVTQVMGLDGSGVGVAVADSGLDAGDAATMHPDLNGRTPAFFYYGSLTDASDEHSHGTHVAGIVAGNGAVGEVDENGALYGLGVAPGAEIITQRIFDGLGGEELPSSFEKMTRDATRAGAVIGSNSWGTDNHGRYDSFAMEFDALVRDADQLQAGDQQYILEFSAGNAGPGMQTVGTPAVAKNVIATGASDNDRPDLFIYADGVDAMADFSSRGPCEDGRIKPDVVAPGTWIASLKSAASTDENAWSPISEYYLYMGGTSQAGPHASGAAAVFVQYYRLNHAGATPSPALVKAALITSAWDMDDSFGTAPIPNMDEGWGRIDLLNLVDPGMRLEYLDQTVLLTNSQVYEHRALVASREQPLKITMTYTDVPGFPGAVPALVNDLDLEVLAPDGTIYKGNQMEAGESVSNPTSRDSLNNVEVLHLLSAQPGEYRISVRAQKVVQDSREDTPAFDQDFALVISGSLAIPGVGEISFDRAMYTAPDQINVTLVDTALAGRPNVQARIQSTTETAGENLVLTAASAGGVYTGAIATARSPVLPSDGKLQVTHNDIIEVSFQLPGGPLRTAAALADLMAPVLSGITATPSFGSIRITWASDESANSTVWFGTNNVATSLTNRVRVAELTTSHTVALAGLPAGLTYYYFVVSADEAGNVTTNNNGGNFFSFVTPTTPPVLLVDQYHDDLVEGPPLTGYTAALDQVGVQYHVYDSAVQGPPDFKSFKAYPVIILRVPEFSLPWTAQDLTDMSNYVNEGGAILLSSMEVLSRLEEATNFYRGLLQVQSFLTDENGSMGAQQIIGVPGDPVAGNLNITMDYTAYDEAWAFLIAFGLLPSGDISDALTPTAEARPILRNDYGQIVGLRWQGPTLNSGRVVFLSFPLDAVPLGSGSNDRAHLLRNILSFLAPQAPGLQSILLDSVAYTLPSVVNVQLGDARLAGRGVLNATAVTATDSAGIGFTLHETTRRGLFMGSFNVYALTNPQQPSLLEAQNGDKLTVSFSDAAAGVDLSTSADIDTQSPVVSDVAAEAEYITATVIWNTSEIADALVQYGESPLLGQTAYDPSPTTTHIVDLSGLAPDRRYYYRVISRDLAGNMKMDDNSGGLYTFQTLAPLAAPWADNMDAGGTNWTVLTAEGSQGEWALGAPGTGPGASHSPPDAWGSNLKAEFLDLAESFLVSPAFMITNGNSATLTFWHWYDFTDLSGEGYDIEFGSIELVVDNGPAQTIALFGEVSDGWERTEIDLSPYIGRLIYVAWHYFLFSLDPWPRPGWFVDDVSVSVSQVLPGTVVISNNLSQAEWVLSGRTYLKGKGASATLTNAGPGEYILEFADVPFYTTPKAQTNTLPAGGTVVFTGTYTFADANSNGISDPWETEYFGSVSPGRTATTDTDGDGATDYAEFIAGTNPKDPVSELNLAAQLLPNEQLNVSWTGATGRSYRVEASTNGRSWTPVSDWIRSGSTNSITYQVTPGTNAAMNLFRLAVRQ